MRDSKNTQRDNLGFDGEKKAYVKPEILSREHLEALAVVCSPPSKADTIACPSGTITS